MPQTKGKPLKSWWNFANPKKLKKLNLDDAQSVFEWQEKYFKTWRSIVFLGHLSRTTGELMSFLHWKRNDINFKDLSKEDRFDIACDYLQQIEQLNAKKRAKAHLKKMTQRAHKKRADMLMDWELKEKLFPTLKLNSEERD